jgi:hypothetical protein
MVNIEAILSYVIKWIVNPLIWLLILIFVSGGILTILYIRKKKRLQYPIIMTTEYGKYNAKAGYYGIKEYLRGLWWTGREIMKTDEGDAVVGFTEDCFTEIDGKRGFECYRDPRTSTVVALKGQTVIRNREALKDIPPGNYVDEAINLLDEIDSETSDRTAKIIQFVAWALVIVFSLISIIVIVQMVKGAQKEASELILNAGGVCAEMGKVACQQICTAIESTGAP